MARTQEVVVMDIGSSKIRILAVERPNNGIFSVKQIIQQSHDGYYDGEWVDGDSTADAIIQAVGRMRDAGVRFKRLYVSVPSEFCVVKTVRTKTSFAKRRKVERGDLDLLYNKNDPFENDMTKVVVNRSSVYYTVEGNKKVVDPEGIFTDELQGYLSYIACQRRVLEFLDKVFQRANVVDVEYTCGMYAEMMCVFDPNVRDNGVVLAIDAGYLSSTVALMRGDGIMQMRSFPCGKGVFAMWLAEGLEIPFASAEALYDKTDLSYEARESDSYSVDIVGADGEHSQMDFPIAKVQSYITECIAAFAENVQCILQGFDETLSITAGMFLLGGGLGLRGADECLSKKLNRKVRLAAPTMCPEYKKPMHAGIIGIAHYAFQQEEKKRNRFWK
ncbi:MAG: hypothetical protein II896_07675 [Clostridia bacterium]|nr:hypothetical protein [Clostridia bacterium]